MRVTVTELDAVFGGDPRIIFGDGLAFGIESPEDAAVGPGGRFVGQNDRDVFEEPRDFGPLFLGLLGFVDAFLQFSDSEQ